MRSRIQQSGFNVKDLEVDSENLILTLENLTRKEIVRVPDSFQLLRFFIDDPKRRLLGKDLALVIREIYQNKHIPDPSSDNDWNLNWYSYSVGIIDAPVIDLSKVINSQNRKQLHETLSLRWGDFDMNHPKFYLANAGHFNVPDDICIRIVTEPEKFYNYGGGNLRHLQSPIVDPGFEGDLILEHVRSNSEADIADPNHVLIFAYRIQQ